MFKVINTKILLGILAALIAIAGILYKQAEDRKAATAAAAQTALILQQQQQRAQDEQDRNAAFMKQVEADGKKHNSLNKTTHDLSHYMP